MSRCLVFMLLALGMIAVGCGGDEGSAGEDADALLKRGFSTDVDSGRMSLNLDLSVEGVKGADGPFRLELSGPFRSRGPTKLPDVDMDFTASGQGVNFEGRVVLLPENAWVEFGGDTYEVGQELWGRAQDSLNREGGPKTFGDAGVNPLKWVKDPETGDTEEISGTEATEVTGELDVAAMLRDFNRLSPNSSALPPATLDQIDEAVGPVEFKAWIGDDDIWRKLSSEATFTVPDDQRRGASGLEGGKISLDMTLAAPNEPVSIESPGEGRPISDLLRALGVPPEALLGPGLAVPAPG
jgi:hypothetical protein